MGVLGTLIRKREKRIKSKGTETGKRINFKESRLSLQLTLYLSHFYFAKSKIKKNVQKLKNTRLFILQIILSYGGEAVFINLKYNLYIKTSPPFELHFFTVYTPNRNYFFKASKKFKFLTASIETL